MDMTESSLADRAGPDDVGHRDMANAIRALAMDAVQQAKSGHPGMPMGMADVATVLFSQFLTFDPKRPDWPDRDRFVLSAGHGSMLLYALLYLTGYEDMTLEELRNFRQLGSRTAGHPEYGLAPGIETTTGPLGQGLANAVGMAIAERVLNSRYGDDLIDHHIYVLAGDGCLMEGISHEAISLAGHLGLGKLIVLFDDNSISIDGPTDLTVSDDQVARFAACGWQTLSADGHDPDSIATAIEAARSSDCPSLIACRTVIGYGAPNKQGTAATHGAPLGEDEVAAAREQLGWPHAPFEIPAPILERWREVGRRGASTAAAWDERLAARDGETRARFEREQNGELSASAFAGLAALKASIIEERPSLATRVSSQKVLDVLGESIPELIGGSADLTGSNNTKAKSQSPITSEDFSGGYIHYGVREHAMAAAMNGIALHGGLIPYGGTFLVFTDYCRPAIRLSALMDQRVVYVMTHDSIGLGEDGPTHQPVEHLAALRAIPNLLVFRPADTIEVAECWELALSAQDMPSVLALTRQAVPTLRREATNNLSARGGYILSPAHDKPQATLIATGSEVEITIAAQEMLRQDGIAASVVSLPCWELFARQDRHYRDEILGENTLRVAVEAAVPLGCERWIGERGAFVGMQSFGASAPCKDLYRNFAITPEAVVETVRAGLS
jgi:transketolase